MVNISLIGFASGWGAQVRGTEKGPHALEKSGILSTLPFSYRWKDIIEPIKTSEEISLSPGLPTLPYISDVCLRLATSVQEILQDHQFPVVIGGDHVVATGTWAGVTQALGLRQKFGLIWIDAHMDAHTMETTPSKAYHGMPLAALLGYGDSPLVDILDKGPVLNPEHVCLIGVRSFEEGEEDLLKKLGVRVYFIDEVKKQGFKSVFEDALRHVKQSTQGFGISLDLDAFDPLKVPGVGTPESNGLDPQEVLPALSLACQDPLFKAFEVVEYNPALDKDEKTLILIRDILKALAPNS